MILNQPSPASCLLVAISLLFGTFSPLVQADVRLPAIISDHMILQKSAKTAVWGWAAPDEDVTVTLDTQSAKAKADANGKWNVALNLSNSGPGPFQLTIAGKNQIVITDVLVGQVWVASGQSNMQFVLKDALGGAEEIAHSANPLLRQFFVSPTEKTTPQADCKNGSTWAVADPSTSGAFSAVGYFFAKRLQNELKVPVAFINDQVGGTASEQWTSQEALDTNPDLKPIADATLKSWDELTEQRNNYPAAFEQWLKAYNREDKPAAQCADFAGMDVPTADWTRITFPPAAVAGPNLPPAGAFWLRKEVTLTADQSRLPNGLELWYFAGCNDYESLYWNGEKVIQFQPKDRTLPIDWTFHPFRIPTNLLKEGRNVLAIRLFSPIQAPQLYGQKNIPPKVLTIGVSPLDGDWLAKAEYALPAVSPEALAAVPPDPILAYNKVIAPNTPRASQLYNGMISPILPYTIAGVVWYQGESNVGRAYQYRTAFPLLINDWRAHWGLGDFPFYFCQLANMYGPSSQPLANSDWAELREAQFMALKLPNTGMAVLHDLGEANTIHPRDKKDVGERLALIALANTYHENIPYSGPLYASNTIEGDKIRLTFQHTDGGLVAKPLNEIGKIYYSVDPPKVLPQPTNPKSQLQGFAICGSDHKWVWADARIDGTTVVVSSDQVPQPVAVRYAWDICPTANLYNGADLPASSFRTDDFPGITANTRYGQWPAPPPGK